MKKLILLLIAPVALLLVMQTATAQEKSMASPEVHRPAATEAALWNDYRPETLSGTLSMVEPGTKAVFVTGADEVSYKFLVTPKTKIQINGTASTFEELAGQAHEQVTITFVARRNGNFAQHISVGG